MIGPTRAESPSGLPTTGVVPDPVDFGDQVQSARQVLLREAPRGLKAEDDLWIGDEARKHPVFLGRQVRVVVAPRLPPFLSVDDLFGNSTSGFSAPSSRRVRSPRKPAGRPEPARTRRDRIPANGCSSPGGTTGCAPRWCASTPAPPPEPLRERRLPAQGVARARARSEPTARRPPQPATENDRIGGRVAPYGPPSEALNAGGDGPGSGFPGLPAMPGAAGAPGVLLCAFKGRRQFGTALGVRDAWQAQ